MDFRELAVAIAVSLAARFEGFRSRPYLCPAGVPTIGYGATFYLNGTKVTLHDPAITREYAMAILVDMVTRIYLPQVLRLCPTLVFESETRLASITDWTLNLGAGSLKASTLRKRINAKAWSAVPTELMKWVKGGGRVLRGLVLRRQAEVLLFI